MPADFIKIQRDQAAATEAAELLSWVRDLRSVYERAHRIRAKMRRNHDAPSGPTTNWSQLETLWGIPVKVTSVGDAANGAVVFGLVSNTVRALEGVAASADPVNATERVG